jgi:hypothetical protein
MDIVAIKARFETLAPYLDERARRLLAATRLGPQAEVEWQRFRRRQGLRAVRSGAGLRSYGPQMRAWNAGYVDRVAP